MVNERFKRADRGHDPAAKTTTFYDRIRREFFDRIVPEEKAADAFTKHGSLGAG